MHVASRLPPTTRALLGSTLTALCTVSAAQPTPDGLWHGHIGIGGSAASGNTSSTTVNLAAQVTRATDRDKISLSALVNHGRSKAGGISTRTADLARVNGRYDRDLDQHLFTFGGGEAETNKPAGVASRLNAHAGAGWHAWRSDTTSWDLFVGAGHAETRFTDGSRRRGLEGLLGEESSHRLGESSSVKQKLVLYPGSDALGSRATFDASLATTIVGGWTFNTAVALRYTSEVPAGTKKTEGLLTFGFGYKF